MRTEIIASFVATILLLGGIASAQSAPQSLGISVRSADGVSVEGLQVQVKLDAFASGSFARPEQTVTFMTNEGGDIVFNPANSFTGWREFDVLHVKVLICGDHSACNKDVVFSQVSASGIPNVNIDIREAYSPVEPEPAQCPEPKVCPAPEPYEPVKCTVGVNVAPGETKEVQNAECDVTVHGNDAPTDSTSAYWIGGLGTVLGAILVYLAKKYQSFNDDVKIEKVTLLKGKYVRTYKKVQYTTSTGKLSTKWVKVSEVKV